MIHCYQVISLFYPTARARLPKGLMFHQSTIAECILNDGRHHTTISGTCGQRVCARGLKTGSTVVYPPSERFSRNELARGRGGLNEEEGVSCAWFACVDTVRRMRPTELTKFPHEQNRCQSISTVRQNRKRAREKKKQSASCFQ